jgi:hypothetical protein
MLVVQLTAQKDVDREADGATNCDKGYHWKNSSTLPPKQA